MINTENYYFFWGGFCSNWVKSPFEMNGFKFENAEQAMMFEKAKLFEDSLMMEKIKQEINPAIVKQLGRKIKNFDEEKWNQNKIIIMSRILIEKFSQHKPSKKKLLELCDLTYFVEASPYDKIWGIGLDEIEAKKTCPINWPGQNLLGKTINSIRPIIKLQEELS